MAGHSSCLLIHHIDYCFEVVSDTSGAPENPYYLGLVVRNSELSQSSRAASCEDNHITTPYVLDLTSHEPAPSVDDSVITSSGACGLQYMLLQIERGGASDYCAPGLFGSSDRLMRQPWTSPCYKDMTLPGNNTPKSAYMLAYLRRDVPSCRAHYSNSHTGKQRIRTTVPIRQATSPPVHSHRSRLWQVWVRHST